MVIWFRVCLPTILCQKTETPPFSLVFPTTFFGVFVVFEKKSSPYYSSLNLPPYFPKTPVVPIDWWISHLTSQKPPWLVVGWLVSNRKAEAEGCVCHRFLRIGLGSVAGTACSAVAFSGDLDLAGGGGLRVLRFFGGEGKRDEMGWMWKEMMFQEMGCFFCFEFWHMIRTRRCGRCM